MDWIKSKSILLIALLLTNAILFWNVLDSRHTFDAKTDEEVNAWAKVKHIAALRGVSMTTDDIPAYVQSLRGVRLEYQAYDADAIAKQLLGVNNLELGKYTNDAGDYMTLENGNKLLYARNIQKGGVLEPLDASQAKLKADQFLNDIAFASGDMRFWDIKRSEAMTTVIYRQYSDTLFLDDAYMAVTFKGDQISTFERKWFNPPEHLEYSRKIIPPSKALFMALDQVPANQDEHLVKALELGYRLDSSSLVSSVKAGEASPYWRVLLDTGEVYYIEAQE